MSHRSYSIMSTLFLCIFTLRNALSITCSFLYQPNDSGANHFFMLCTFFDSKFLVFLFLFILGRRLNISLWISFMQCLSSWLGSYVGYNLKIFLVLRLFFNPNYIAICLIWLQYSKWITDDFIVLYYSTYQIPISFMHYQQSTFLDSDDSSALVKICLLSIVFCSVLFLANNLRSFRHSKWFVILHPHSILM